MSLSVTEQFGYIMSCQGTQELVPFLLKLSPKDVKAVRAKALALLQHGIPNARPRPARRGWTVFPPLAASTGEALAAALPPPAPADTSFADTPFIDPTDEEGALFFLTGLATYTRKEAFGRGFHWAGSLMHNYFSSRWAAVRAVLQHARPAWLSDWLMGGFGSSLANYWLLRELEDAGFIEYRPQQFAFQLAWLALDQRPGQLAERLGKDEKALTRDLPLQFEYEASMARLDGRSAANYEKHTWQRVLLGLVEAGHLHRADIRTRCLLALRRDFRRPLLTWFKELFLSLQPTPAECLAHQADLVELLAHAQPLVVNFALNLLKAVWLEPGFDLAPLLQAADSLVRRPELKTGLQTLLACLARLPRQEAAHAPAVARLLAAALAHPDAAVQARAAKHLADLLSAKTLLLPSADTSAILVALADQAALLGPAARAALAPWLAAPSPAPAPKAATVYAPLAQFVPDISPATAIAPVADWHELLFLSAAMLRQNDPVALERWLDGLLRLHGQLPADYQQQLQPYIKRLVPWLSSKSTLAEVLAHLAEWPPAWAKGLFEALLLSWYEGFASARVSQIALGRQPIGGVGQAAYASAADPLCYPNQQRLAFAEVLLAQQTALPLLSTFTHQPHYVSPVVLVEKLLRYQQYGTAPNLADLTIALARTPAGGPVAEVAQQLLPALAHPGLRELLGWYFSPTTVSPAPPCAVLPRLVAWPTTLDAALPGLWAVAARTKYPAAQLPWLAALEQAAETALAATPAPPPPPAWAGTPLPAPPLVFTSPPGVVAGLPLYSAHAVMRPRHQRGPEGWDGYAALRTVYTQLHALLPQYPAPLYRHTLRCAAPAGQSAGASRELLQSALYTLLPAGPVLAEEATQLLATGLVHPAPACRALAQQVLEQTINHRRLMPAALGQALGQLLAADAPVSRLTEGLAALSLGPPTAAALRQILDALLPELPSAPPWGLRRLLELYADLQAQLVQPIPAAVRERLASWDAGVLKPVSAALLAAA
ncbi:hypothetical protein HHL22_03795 [Hymenobacter sp. RP-2-7]|uniref:HEAT repeat domain-containing protein n=1 Tax=Hymenobacter polaris TaxID=2682546 RepID=A0A7Y0FLF1_9BACT|nr:DUF6493 family protein [Hymenobacter polaris]NML64321.1 hypothetical protein [Hymenobacter polaris]